MTDRRPKHPRLPGLPGAEETPIRLLQWASVIRRALQQRLADGLSDPRFQGMCTVLSVEVSPDESRALVRISVAPADRGRLTLSALRSAGAHLRHVVRDESTLRHVPRLDFVLDESAHRQASIEDAIAEGLARERPTDDANDDHHSDSGTP